MRAEARSSGPDDPVAGAGVERWSEHAVGNILHCTMLVSEAASPSSAP